jgi:hypothetical protein
MDNRIKPDNEMITREIKELVSPTDSKLAIVIAKVESLPASVPKNVVDMLVRVAFAGGYAQLHEDIQEMNEVYLDEISIRAVEFIDKGFEIVDKMVCDYLEDFTSE